MCGFVVLLNKNINVDICKSIFFSLSKINNHRGPDKIKLNIEDNTYILFRRLKIIDLTNKSNQPFFSSDRKVKIIFNGEIYNFLELRNDLKKFGVKFKTNSDTEVLLNSYLFYGIKFVNKIRGMFSIIIFDKLQNKTFIIRDHFGQKPLFYCFLKDNLLISSEIKDILYFKKKIGAKIEKNSNIILQYLMRGWADSGSESFYKDIFIFPPSSIGTLNNNKLIIKKFWSLDINRNNQFKEDEFRYNFSQNLKIHLRSDVPIAFTLSGGLDSSSLVRTSMDCNILNYKAFSLKLQKNLNDEKYLINLFIKKHNLKHEFFSPEKFYNDNIIETLIKFQDEPTGSFSFVNQFLLRKFIRSKGFKVLIVGEGGDEVLGGYSRMFLPYLHSIFNKNKIPDDIINNILMITGWSKIKLKKNINNFLNKKNLFHDFENLNIFKFSNIQLKDLPKNILFYNKVTTSDKNCYKKFLCNHLFVRDMPHILRQEDRISMANSIENRSPFIDHKFVEYVFSHNTNYFMKHGLNKFMLRTSMENYLPKEFFFKKKIGRPGSSEVLIFKYYSNKFIELLNSRSIPFFDNKKILNQFILDKKNNDIKNVDLYFRFLSFLIWDSF